MPPADTWSVVAAMTAVLAAAALVLLAASGRGRGLKPCRDPHEYMCGKHGEHEGFHDYRTWGAWGGPAWPRARRGARRGACGCATRQCGPGAACGLLPAGPWDPTGDSAWAGPNGMMRKYYSNDDRGNGFGPRLPAAPGGGCGCGSARADPWKQGWANGAARGWD